MSPSIGMVHPLSLSDQSGCPPLSRKWSLCYCTSSERVSDRARSHSRLNDSDNLLVGLGSFSLQTRYSKLEIGPLPVAEIRQWSKGASASNHKILIHNPNKSLMHGIDHEPHISSPDPTKYLSVQKTFIAATVLLWLRYIRNVECSPILYELRH